MTHRTSPTCNQADSLASFIAAKAEFDTLLADLQQMSADQFGADPEAVLWGHVGSLTHRNRTLREVTDAYFKRGEFAD